MFKILRIFPLEDVFLKFVIIHQLIFLVEGP